MVGRELSFEPDPRRAAADAAVALEVRDLVADPVVSASFSLRYGEIVCLAGLLGAGRTEVCEAIFGARPIQSGSVLVEGRELRPRSPPDSMAAGISMLPEDRKEGGLFMDFTITANVVAANLPAYTQFGSAVASRDAARSASNMPTSCASRRRASSARCAICRAATSRRCCSPNGWRASRAS